MARYALRKNPLWYRTKFLIYLIIFLLWWFHFYLICDYTTFLIVEVLFKGVITILWRRHNSLFTLSVIFIYCCDFQAKDLLMDLVCDVLSWTSYYCMSFFMLSLIMDFLIVIRNSVLTAFLWRFGLLYCYGRLATKPGQQIQSTGTHMGVWCIFDKL